MLARKDNERGHPVPPLLQLLIALRFYGAGTFQVVSGDIVEAPADPARRSLWERNLHRADKPLTADCAVCELHFQPHFIVRDYVHQINGEEVRLPRGKPTLTPNAVPTILPNVPAYLSKHVTPARKQRKRKASEAAILPKKARVSSAGEDHSVDEPASNGEAGEADTTDTVGGCEPAEADASLTVDALKHATVPNKRWTLHEMQDNEGLSTAAPPLLTTPR
ncbi:hypothetical protein HPB49_026350 [Dermacentor silvarum]|nr:hypothetical protein HPB49_026350 [Dermacentor silvarum]